MGGESRQHSAVVLSHPAQARHGPGPAMPRLRLGADRAEQAVPPREQRGLGPAIPPSGHRGERRGPARGRGPRGAAWAHPLTSMIFSFFFWSAFLLPPAGCCCFLGGMAGRRAGAGPGGAAGAGTGSGRAAAAGEAQRVPRGTLGTRRRPANRLPAGSARRVTSPTAGRGQSVAGEARDVARGAAVAGGGRA